MSGDDGLTRYLSVIGRVPMLAREEEAALARRYREQGDPRDRERLVAANLRFVVSVARRYRYRGLSMEDLVAEGNVGLLRAAERYDADRGVRFVTYAAWWIRRSILAALARSRRQDGRTGSGSSTRRPRPVAHVSFEAAGRPGRRPPAEVIADDRGEDPDQPVHRDELRRAVGAGLAFLPEREARVLRLYYGLDGRPALGLAEVGRELGVSRERARQLKARGLEQLRRCPRGEELRLFVG